MHQWRNWYTRTVQVTLPRRKIGKEMSKKKYFLCFIPTSAVSIAIVILYIVNAIEIQILVMNGRCPDHLPYFTYIEDLFIVNMLVIFIKIVILIFAILKKNKKKYFLPTTLLFDIMICIITFLLIV